MYDNRTVNTPAPMDPEIQKAVISQLLSSPGRNDILDLETVRELYRKAMEQKLLEKYTFPEKPSSDGYYHCAVKDPVRKNGYRHMKAKSLEELQQKVLAHEHGEFGEARKTFREVYEILQQRTGDLVKTRERSYSVSNTVSRHWQTYNRFFAGTDFEKLHVDEIT
ncbi:MAG: hypothetical protein ACSW8K_11715, partial [bacterium]